MGRSTQNVGLAGLPGIWLPPDHYTTAEMISELGVCYPLDHKEKEKRGRPLPPNWAERQFGIVDLPRDYRWDNNRLIKPSRKEGGLYGVDYGVRAARIALKNAGLSIEEIGMVVEVTATPDTVGLGGHLRYYYEELGLAWNVPIMTLPVGCAGFFDALSHCEAYLRSGMAKYAMAIFQNCPSAPFGTPELREICKTDMRALACHMVFADGAVAMIFNLTENADEGFFGRESNREFGRDYDLMDVTSGGNFYPHSTSSEHGAGGYRMNGGIVQKAFVRLMLRNYDNACKMYKSAGLGEYDPAAIASFVPHQASLPAILKMLEARPEIPRDHVPMIMRHKGNLAVASGPCALTECLEKSVRGSLHMMMLLGSDAGGAGYGSVFFRKNF